MNESIKIKTIIKMINERLASKAVVLLKREPKALWVLLAKCYQYWELLWVVASRSKDKECLKGEVTLRQIEANAAPLYSSSSSTLNIDLTKGQAITLRLNWTSQRINQSRYYPQRTIHSSFLL